MKPKKKVKPKRLKIRLIEISKMMTPGYIAMADNGFWATSLYKKVALRNLTKLIHERCEL
jgi:hypothetical protein